MLFTFDAAYTNENIEREIVSGFHLDPVAGTRSLRRIRKLARDHDADVFVAHDAAAFAGYRRAPAYYGAGSGG
jgi:4-pyridoxolactonase